MIIENSIQDFGPKDYSPVFIDLLQKKFTNLSDFKKPKELQGSKPDLLSIFMNNVYRAVAAHRLYLAIKDSEYNGIFGLLKELKSAPAGDYFEWAGSLITKILVVRLLIEA